MKKIAIISAILMMMLSYAWLCFGGSEIVVEEYRELCRGYHYRGDLTDCQKAHIEKIAGINRVHFNKYEVSIERSPAYAWIEIQPSVISIIDFHKDIKCGKPDYGSPIREDGKLIGGSDWYGPERLAIPDQGKRRTYDPTDDSVTLAREQFDRIKSALRRSLIFFEQSGSSFFTLYHKETMDRVYDTYREIKDK